MGSGPSGGAFGAGPRWREAGRSAVSAASTGNVLGVPGGVGLRVNTPCGVPRAKAGASDAAEPGGAVALLTQGADLLPGSELQQLHQKACQSWFFPKCKFKFPPRKTRHLTVF